MVGLEKFTSPVYCSEVTKDIVLKIRPARARVNDANGFGIGKMDRTYKHLLPRKPGEKSLLKVLIPHHPKEIALDTANHDKCCITLIPANHCPGSVMFLIQMWGRNVLYTGDIRAEPWWVESLTKQSQLAPFVAPHHGINHRPYKFPQKVGNPDELNPHMSILPSEQSSSEPSKEVKCSRSFTPLDNIYLDTSSLLTKIDVLTKEEAIQTTIEMMSAYPDDTNFFINSWTWGYEELLEQIAVHFESLVGSYLFGTFAV